VAKAALEAEKAALEAARAGLEAEKQRLEQEREGLLADKVWAGDVQHWHAVLNVDNGGKPDVVTFVLTHSEPICSWYREYAWAHLLALTQFSTWLPFPLLRSSFALRITW
jgi:hypothetical protein